MSLHTVVIGAGVVGASVALALLREGQRVTLLEPGEAGGEQAASYGNGAWISTASVVPMSMPGLWRKVPGYLLDRHGPLVIRPTSLPQLAPWLWRFVGAGATVPRVRRTARALAALLCDAPERHGAQAAAAGVADLMVRAGLVYVYPDRAAFEAEALAWQLRRENGVQWAELDADALRVLAPQLNPDYRFGVQVASGGHCLDPGAYVAAIVAHACSLGADRVPARAIGWQTEAGRLLGVRTDRGVLACDRAVVCAGIGSAVLARAAGDFISLASERGYHVVLPAEGLSLNTPVMPSDGKMALTLTRAGLRVAGQVELAVPSRAPDWRRADILLHHARRLFPAAGFDETRVRARWLGHRPSTPDGLPVISASERCAAIFYACGHGHVGLAAAPATAALVADLITGRAPAIDPTPYRISRFRG